MAITAHLIHVALKKTHKYLNRKTLLDGPQYNTWAEHT